MKKHLNEYQRMIAMQAEIDKMQARSDELTSKIEVARELPGQILNTATYPIAGLYRGNGSHFTQRLSDTN